MEIAGQSAAARVRDRGHPTLHPARATIRQPVVGGENREPIGAGINPSRAPPAPKDPVGGNRRNISHPACFPLSEPVPLSFPGTSSRRWSARLGRQNQPHNTRAHLGCSRRKPRRDRRFHSPLTPRRLRVIWPHAIAVRRTPVRMVPAGEHRPPRPARSAAGTARRTHRPSLGGFAVTVYFAKHCEPDLATSLFVFRRRKPAV